MKVEISPIVSRNAADGIRIASHVKTSILGILTEKELSHLVQPRPACSHVEGAWHDHERELARTT